MRREMGRSGAGAAGWWLGAVAALASCADTSPTVKPDEMSAARHHEEAAREAEAARHEASLHDPAVVMPVPAGDARRKDYLYTVEVYNPTDTHLAAAAEHREHARQHESAARFLERFEEHECRDFPPASRAGCPLLAPVVGIDDIDRGVRVRFKEGARVDAIIAHMRCHYAFARARAFEAASSCPLYLRGIEIRRALDPMAVEILSSDPSVVREIRIQSRAEAVFVR